MWIDGYTLLHGNDFSRKIPFPVDVRPPILVGGHVIDGLLPQLADETEEIGRTGVGFCVCKELCAVLSRQLTFVLADYGVRKDVIVAPPVGVLPGGVEERVLDGHHGRIVVHGIVSGDPGVERFSVVIDVVVSH